MELTGDLSDFALADILQILALSRKTGILSVETGVLLGKVVIEEGRVTYASILPGETLLERLVRENHISEGILGNLRVIGASGDGVWSLESLIVESGLMTESDLNVYVKGHIQNVVGKLVGLEKGRFGIALNETSSVGFLNDLTLCEGLDVREALLGVAKEIDEEGKVVAEDWGYRSVRDMISNKNASDNLRGAKVGLQRMQLQGAIQSVEEVNSGTSLLCSLLTELRSYSFEAEVILIIMRYASEVASRGILFVVKPDKIYGLGQFGVKSRLNGVSADECVRKVEVSLSKGNIFGEVAISRIPYIGEIPKNNMEHEKILKPIGGTEGRLSMFALPVVCQGNSVFIVYGDDYLGTNNNFKGIDGLLALVNQAGIVLEKMVLERLLDQTGVKVSGSSFGLV